MSRKLEEIKMDKTLGELEDRLNAKMDYRFTGLHTSPEATTSSKIRSYQSRVDTHRRNVASYRGEISAWK